MQVKKYFGCVFNVCKKTRTKKYGTKHENIIQSRKQILKIIQRVNSNL